MSFKNKELIKSLEITLRKFENELTFGKDLNYETI